MSLGETFPLISHVPDDALTMEALQRLLVSCRSLIQSSTSLESDWKSIDNDRAYNERKLLLRQARTGLLPRFTDYDAPCKAIEAAAEGSPSDRTYHFLLAKFLFPVIAHSKPSAEHCAALSDVIADFLKRQNDPILFDKLVKLLQVLVTAVPDQMVRTLFQSGTAPERVIERLDFSGHFAAYRVIMRTCVDLVAASSRARVHGHHL
jgi:hypothetical protein